MDLGEDWVSAAGGENDVRAEQYRVLRETCPVARGLDPAGTPRWSVFRYDDVVAAGRNPEGFSNGLNQRLPRKRLPLESDAPQHTAVRRLMMTYMAPRPIAAMEPAVRRLALDLVAPLVAAGGGDAARAIARPLPAQVLLAWFGRPHDEWVCLKDWSDDVLPRPFSDAADQLRYETGDSKLWSYSEAVVAERLASPRPPETDPVSGLLAGGLEVETVVGIVRLLVSAGHDSTSQAIGICIHHFATHPEDQARVRAEPELLKTAIEEILRVNSPVVAMPRTAASDVELGGREIRAGERVLLNWASANRDAAVFDLPDQCTLDRRPNPHLVFGTGIHTCIGAPLARQELRVSLELLFELTGSFEMSAAPTMQRMNHLGYETLPIRLTPGRH